MYNKIATATLVTFLTLTHATGQSRSGNMMQFLDVPQACRLVGSGGLHASSGVSMPSMVFHNAGSVADTIGGTVDLNVLPVTDGIKYASAAYSHDVENIGVFTIGLLYAGYGDFERRDEDGVNLGTFGANEGALYLNYCRAMAPWLRMGATIKPMFSKMADNTAVGLAIDMGATTSFVDNRLTAALSIRNAGAIIKKYTSDDNGRALPFDVRLGMTYKPEHAPFRFLLTLKDLTQWNLATSSDKIDAGDNILRHTLIGVEFIPVRAFYFAMGYDHRKRKELTARDTGGMAGFSWGVGLEIAKIRIQYSHNRYHVAGSLNSICLSTNLKRFIH